MSLLDEVTGGLAAEGDELAQVLAGLSAQRWRLPTPAPGWTIAHQVAHLAWTDEIALLAAEQPEEFTTETARQRDAATEAGSGLGDWAADERARTGPEQLLERWQAGRSRLADALIKQPSDVKLPWFGPPMNAVSMATARLMETWAHGQDVLDTLGVSRTATSRLRHIAHLGVRTRDFAYRLNDRTPPDRPFRVELTAPDGGLWTWGDEHEPERVTGPALDFCLLVCQRRHPSELALVVEGAQAREWLGIAQVFAGAPGGGRPPGSATGGPVAGSGPAAGSGAAEATR